MDRRTRIIHRQSITRPEPFLKYLKPGALTRLLDSKISTRSHRICSIAQISPSSNESQPLVTDGFPCFEGRMYGPQCLQRKKLVGAKAVMFLNSSQSSPVMNLSDPVIDVLNSDSNTVAAH